MWLVPLTQTTKTTIPLQQKLYQTEKINNVHQTTTKQDLITYLHQCLFSPTKATLIKAIHNYQLLGFPGLTAEVVQRFLPVSTVTIKVHMHRTPKNVRSTRPSINHKPSIHLKKDEDTNPPQDTQAPCEMFCFAALADAVEGTIYTYLTGRFPVRSYKGHQYLFLPTSMMLMLYWLDPSDPEK